MQVKQASKVAKHEDHCLCRPRTVPWTCLIGLVRWKLTSDEKPVFTSISKGMPNILTCCQLSTTPLLKPSLIESIEHVPVGSVWTISGWGPQCRPRPRSIGLCAPGSIRPYAHSTGVELRFCIALDIKPEITANVYRAVTVNNYFHRTCSHCYKL